MNDHRAPHLLIADLNRIDFLYVIFAYLIMIYTNSNTNNYTHHHHKLIIKHFSKTVLHSSLENQD